MITTIKIAQWHLRNVHSILSGQNGYSAVLIITNSNQNMDLMALKRRIPAARRANDTGSRLSISNLAVAGAPNISVYNEKLLFYPTL